MNIINIYEKYFTEDYKEVFNQISNHAKDYKIYIVGGLVRDMLLNRKSNDIDIMIIGNAINFAKYLESEGIAKIKSLHKDFVTAKVIINNICIDIASTRTEIYEKPGHLPVIKKVGCPLSDDFSRRDFTINSIGMSLNKENFGEIIDYYNGIQDLKKGILRVLHEKSFIDDPSRIIRGLKYASRLNFNLEENTYNLQKQYLSNINYDMSYKRISKEFLKIQWNRETFNTLIEQGIYKLITDKKPENLDFWMQTSDCYIYFCLLLPDKRFEVPKDIRNIIEDCKTIINIDLQDRFNIYKTFSNKDIRIPKVLSILGYKPAKIYLQELQNIKLQISGEDLKKLGVQPSKIYKEIFENILKEKIKNPSLLKIDEIEFAKKFIKNKNLL